MKPNIFDRLEEMWLDHQSTLFSDEKDEFRLAVLHTTYMGGAVAALLSSVSALANVLEERGLDGYTEYVDHIDSTLAKLVDQQEAMLRTFDAKVKS